MERVSHLPWFQSLRAHRRQNDAARDLRRRLAGMPPEVANRCIIDDGVILSEIGASDDRWQAWIGRDAYGWCGLWTGPNRQQGRMVGSDQAAVLQSLTAALRAGQDGERRTVTPPALLPSLPWRARLTGQELLAMATTPEQPAGETAHED